MSRKRVQLRGDAWARWRDRDELPDPWPDVLLAVWEYLQRVSVGEIELHFPHLRPRVEYLTCRCGTESVTVAIGFTPGVGETVYVDLIELI